MKPASPGEYRMTGTRRGPAPWREQVGEFVPPAAAQLLREALTLPAYSILHAVGYGDDRPAPRPFLEELAARGYDLATLRFSLFQKGYGTPRRPRVVRCIPGALVLRWGWLSYDHSPDVTGTFAAPASRADLNLAFSLLSHPTTPTRQPVASYTGPSQLKKIEQAGWDMRTLDFRIDRRTVPAASS